MQKENKILFIGNLAHKKLPFLATVNLNILYEINFEFDNFDIIDSNEKLYQIINSEFIRKNNKDLLNYKSKFLEYI